MEKCLGDTVSFNWIHERLPLGITFNDTVDKCVAHFGAFDGYLYIDSGVSLWAQHVLVEWLADWHTEKQAAISAVTTSNDSGLKEWGIPTFGGEYTLPIGKAFNMHFQLFDESWRKAYGRVIPDIFASNTSESVFTFMAAGIEKKVQIHRGVSVLHVLSMDGPSSGFRKQLLFPGAPNQKGVEQIYEEGRALGYGYEEIAAHGRWKHDPSLYDDAGRVVDPSALRAFIKANLFVPESLFSYQRIQGHFKPGKR